MKIINPNVAPKSANMSIDVCLLFCW